jgi:Mrp family chromosome partitioning ATPase/capsular polysaccharide biosynthesis protein
VVLRSFRSLILRQWGLIVICVLVTGIGALIVSTITTPIYVSSATVQVTFLTGGPSQADELASTEAELATSYPVLQAVASHYNGLTETALSREVSAEPKSGTRLFEIDVQDSDSGRAANLANTIASTLIQQQMLAIKQGDAAEQGQLEQDLDKTANQIATITDQINAAPASNQTQMMLLQTQLTALEQHYNQWQTLLAQSQISDAQNSNFLYLAQSAQPNYSPLRPNIPLNIGMGLLMGLCLGLLVAGLYAELTVCEHSLDELKYFLKWPVLGTIWRTTAPLSEVLVHPPSQALNLDAYRSLEANLSFASLEGPLRTLVVTSALASEGKSTVAANLAVSMARTGKNTVLVDANLRHPALQTLFQMVGDKPGLSDALLALGNITNAQTSSGLPTTGSLEMATPRIPLESFCYSVSLPNLRIMPSGPLPLDPATLFESRSMQDLLTLLAGCGSDVVIFDTPATSDFVDARLLAAKVDATLVVVDPALPTKRQIRQMKLALRQAGTRVVGCVFTKQSPQDSSARSSHGHAVPKKTEVAISSAFSQRETSATTAASGSSVTNQVKGLVNTAFHDGNDSTK